ncbi:hypothetical protein ACJJIX_13795 [Microbulbifer sp. VAAC004]|uniref:hypothetical protein n=1 Tax=unclassified Microbulbifer TaxID=2619833 RepID=UPI00403A3BC0
MEDHVYSPTTFWQLFGGINDFTAWFMPFFLFAASLVWFYRERSILSGLSLFAGILVTASRVAHMLIPSVHSIALGHSEPTIEQNPIIWFLYVQALNIGSFIFVVCVGYHFAFSQTYNKQRQQRPSGRTC